MDADLAEIYSQWCKIEEQAEKDRSILLQNKAVAMAKILY